MEYLLSGKLFDIDGNRYQSSSGHGKSGRKYTYYRCPATGHIVPQEKLERAVAEEVQAFLSSDHVAGIIADLVMEEQEVALSDDLDAMDALRKRLADNEREQARMVDLAAKTGATDAVAAKLDELVAERQAVADELAELEKGTPVFDRDHVEFWVHEVVGKKDPLEVIALFVKRVVLDREGERFHVEFIIDGGDDGGNETNPLPDAPDGGSCKSQLAESWGFEPQTPFWGVLA